MINKEALELVQKCLDDWPYAATRVVDIMTRLEKVKELLKEQEQAMPTWSQGKAYCGKCGQRLPRKRADRKINYCGYCGQAVKWE